jgi:hypothetical protein
LVQDARENPYLLKRRRYNTFFTALIPTATSEVGTATYKYIGPILLLMNTFKAERGSIFVELGYHPCLKRMSTKCQLGQIVCLIHPAPRDPLSTSYFMAGL